MTTFQVLNSNLTNNINSKLHVKDGDKTRCGKKIENNIRYDNFKDSFYNQNFETINETFICKICVKLCRRNKKNINHKKSHSTILRKKGNKK